MHNLLVLFEWFYERQAERKSLDLNDVCIKPNESSRSKSHDDEY